METASTRRQWALPQRGTWLRALGLGLAFLLLGAIAAVIANPPSRASAVWLPAGVSTAVVFRTERRQWPLLLATVFGAEVLLVRGFGGPLLVALTWGLANVLRTSFGAWLLQERAGPPLRFNRVQDVVGLVLYGGVLSPLPSATLGAGVQSLLGAGSVWGVQSFTSSWVDWWLSDGLGTLLVAPLVLTWWPLRPPMLPRSTVVKWPVLLGLVALAAFVLFESRAPFGVFPSLPYASFPLLLWAAFWLGPRGASTGAVLLGASAMWFTYRGHGPFATLPLLYPEKLLSVQGFAAVMSLSSLVVAALVCERQWRESTERLLARASAILARSLNPQKTLPELANVLVPDLVTGFAAWERTDDGEVRPLVSRGVSPPLEAELRERVKAAPTPAPWSDPAGRAVLAPLLCEKQEVRGALALVSEDPLTPLGAREAALARDLAYRCHLSLENAHLYQQAQDALRRRDEFIAIAAHELRTPLTASRLQLESLARMLHAFELPDAVWAKLQVLARQESRLSRLVDSLLDVSGLQVGQVALQREEVELSALVHDVTERLAAEAAQANAPLELHLEEGIVGLWDRLRLEQVLTNLLANALKFGAGHPIEVETCREGEHAQLVVRDHGMGMPPEVLERIFGRFEQAVPASQYGGLGLGLYLTQQLVESHGGRIWARSQPGQGATFVVDLPVLPPTAEHPGAAQALLH